jgi:predicted O-methyltransferase YrrM
MPASVQAVLERLGRDGTVVARSDGSVHQVFPVAITMIEGKALRHWIVHERAHTTIEIGLGYGISTLHICQGLQQVGGPAPRHVAIDPYQSRFASCGLQLLEDAAVRNMVEHLEGRSETVLPRLLDRGLAMFDLAFVDGNHRFDSVFVDLFYLSRLVKLGGIIFVDDYQLPGVRRAASFYVANLGWSVCEVSPAHAEHQWAVYRTSAQPDERPFTYFVDF